MFVWLLLGCLFVSAVTANDHHLAKKLLAQVDSDSAKNCDPKRYMEWNEAVEARYKIYKKNLGFEQDECLLAPLIKESGFGPSGAGSSAAFTEPLRKLLRQLFRDQSMNIKSFFDAPCGDWVWMQHVDLSNIVYMGGDITATTIKENTRCFSKHNVNFVQFDLTCNKIPEVDLMLTRDVLFHLKPEISMQVLENISKSSVRYFLSTTFMNSNAENPFTLRSYGETQRQNSTIGYRDINLFDAPYCLPKPLLKIQEAILVDGKPRYVALWKLPFKVGDCAEVKAKGDAVWKNF